MENNYPNFFSTSFKKHCGSCTCTNNKFDIIKPSEEIQKLIDELYPD